MPNIADYLNELTAKAMEHPLAPLLDLAAEKKQEEDERRRFAEKIALLEKEGAITSARATQLQSANEKFQAQQNELNRANALKLAEVHGKAIVDRMSEAQLATLKARYPMKAGEDLDTWHERIAKEQADPVNKLLGQINAKRDEIDDVLAAEDKRRQVAAGFMAAGSENVKAIMDQIGAADSTAKRFIASAKNTAELLKNLRDNKRAGAANQIQNAIDQEKERLLSGTDQHGRNLVPESQDAILKKAALTDDLKRLSQGLDIRLRQTDFLGWPYLDFSKTLDAIGPAGGGAATPTLPADLARAVALRPAVAPAAPTTQPAMPGPSILQRMGITANLPRAPIGPSADQQVGSFLSNIGRTSGLTAPGAPSRGAYIPPPRQSPQIDAQIANIWGPDAPALMNDAAKLAEQSGIPPEHQQAVFQAAIAGDTSAQGQVADVLNFLRNAKQPGAFNFAPNISDFAPAQINTNLQPANLEPAYLPAR